MCDTLESLVSALSNVDPLFLFFLFPMCFATQRVRNGMATWFERTARASPTLSMHASHASGAAVSATQLVLQYFRGALCHLAMHYAAQCVVLSFVPHVHSGAGTLCFANA